ncbi:MAG: response regulator [Solobacterium sp.]|nr:response regulator [Solobacterium sp.]
MKESELGSRIKTLRLQHNMTQAQLADKVGVTDKAVSKWERNLSYPDIALFPSLADVLGVSVNDLLRECEDEFRPSRLLQVCEVSRDVRMPLSIMLGFVEIARRDHDDPQRLMKYLEGIKVSGEYMMELLQSVLQVSSHHVSNGSPDAPFLEPDELDRFVKERIAEAPGLMAEADFSGRRILIAEDMEINREIAAEILKQTGAEVDFAEDGRVCVRKMRTAPAGYYDLILMDLAMPNMDGFEATRQIRELRTGEKANIPIIAMTANVSDNDRNEAVAAGMNAFTEKPILIDRLFETLKQYLSVHR